MQGCTNRFITDGTSQECGNVHGTAHNFFIFTLWYLSIMSAKMHACKRKENFGEDKEDDWVLGYEF